MIRVMIVYESMFGNTELVARAVGDGFVDCRVSILEVGSAPDSIDDDVDLLIVGGPTHAFSLSRPASRLDAAKHNNGKILSSGRGLREWLAVVSVAATVRFAAFDTHVEHPKMLRHLGSAAPAIVKSLNALLEAEPIVEPQHFWVQGTLGPLADGELGRAHRWGQDLASGFVDQPR